MKIKFGRARLHKPEFSLSISVEEDWQYAPHHLGVKISGSLWKWWFKVFVYREVPSRKKVK